MERKDPDPNPQIADQAYRAVADLVPNGTSRAPIKMTVNAIIRIDHCQPRLGYVDRRMIGNMTAPMDDPASVIPIARPRLRTNSFPTMAMATTIVIAAPILPNTPRQSMKCQ